jgi:molybdopterin-synthase adenylyltransferase
MRVVLFTRTHDLRPGEIRVEPARFVDSDVVQVGALPGVAAPERAVVFAATGPAGVPIEQLALHARATALQLDPGTQPSAVVEVAGAAARAWIRRGDAWREASVMRVDTEQVFARNGGVLESDAVADRTVAVVGLGSGGGEIASQLAKAGVGGFVLVDHDTLEPHNVGRHVCDLADVGRRKTAAVADHVRRRNPAARIVTLDADVVAQEEDLAGALASADVLVCATDSNRSRRVVNRIALETGKVALFGRAYRRACGGDAIRVTPGRGPCYECLFRAGQREEVASARSAQATPYSDVPVVAEPGLSLDIAPIAHMVARLALVELARGRAPGLASLDLDLTTPMYVYANRREGEFAGWAPLARGPRAQTPLRWYAVSAPANPVCPACQPEAFLAQMRGTAGPA